MKIFSTDVTLSGSWNIAIVYPEWFGAVGNGVTDDTLSCQKACSFGAGHTILFSFGKIYILNNDLQVYSNSEIIIEGTLKDMTQITFFRLYLQNTPGYTGLHDVYIHGSGLVDVNANNIEGHSYTPFRIGHANNIRIEDITVKNYGIFHAMEISGSKNVKIKNVTFLGQINKTGDFRETIQIEMIADNGGAPGITPYDGTVSRDIIIDGCRFTPSEETEANTWYGCIGNHSAYMETDMPEDKMCKNISIRNCIFENLGGGFGNDHPRSTINTKSAISFFGMFKNVEIRDNVFLNIAVAVYIGRYCTDFIISNNTMIDTSNAVNLGCIGGPLKNIIIQNNYIKPAVDAQNCCALWAGSYDQSSYGVQLLVFRNNVIILTEAHQEYAIQLQGSHLSNTTALLYNNIIKNTDILETPSILKGTIHRFDYKGAVESNPTNNMVMVYDFDSGMNA